MDLAVLRRAFRARPGTTRSNEFATFIEGLETDERAWGSLVSILQTDVVPVVCRYHPAAEADEITSTCLVGAFESWVPEWLACFDAVARARRLLGEERHDEAFSQLAKHSRFRGNRAEKARALWRRRKRYEALGVVEGTGSARSYFIARTRAQINESQRKQRRRSHLLARHCSDALGVGASRGRQAVAPQARAASVCCSL